MSTYRGKVGTMLDIKLTDTSPEDKQSRKRMLELINGHSYIDILLLNNLHDLDGAMDQLIALYEKLFEYGMFLSGFQFVGLIVDNKPTGLREELAFFFLGLGFFSSIFAALTSFVAFEFFKSMKNEAPELVVEGSMRYKNFFRLADFVLFMDTGLFLLSLNIVVHSVIRVEFCITLNVIAFVMIASLCLCHYLVVIRRQIYTLPDGTVLKRRAYTDRLR